MRRDRREYRYTVDSDGRIFHDGSEIIDAAVLGFFLRSMQRTPEGRYLAMCQGERNWFETADTPLVVQRLGLGMNDGRLVSIRLVFAGDYQEPLDPACLEAEADHLYCRVRGGALRARFGRIAIQQLGPYLVDLDGGVSINVGGSCYPIRQLRPDSRSDITEGLP